MSFGAKDPHTVKREKDQEERTTGPVGRTGEPFSSNCKISSKVVVAAIFYFLKTFFRC